MTNTSNGKPFERTLILDERKITEIIAKKYNIPIKDVVINVTWKPDGTYKTKALVKVSTPPNVKTEH